jgi:hypothetical protein
MRKGWTVFLIGALLAMTIDAGVAQALTCTHSATQTTGNPNGCSATGIGNPCPSGFQLTGGACSSDPSLSLLSSDILSTNGQLSWSCTYELPSVDGVCQGRTM